MWVTFILTGFSNAVNLTDGLDGLAAGLMAIAVLTLGLFAYVGGRVDTSAYLQLFYLRGAGELTVFCGAVVGACIGFLWYNAHPAQVFMGDTGALALGGALGSIAILLKSEFLLLIVGAVFVAETTSVILQRTVFKYRKRRFGLEYAQKTPRVPARPAAPSFRDDGLAGITGRDPVLDSRRDVRDPGAQHAQVALGEEERHATGSIAAGTCRACRAPARRTSRRVCRARTRPKRRRGDAIAARGGSVRVRVRLLDKRRGARGGGQNGAGRGRGASWWT